MKICLQGFLGHTHTHTFWILLKQEMMGGSGISWTICISFAPHSRQITTPVPHHSIFYGPDALPDAQSTVSKHWRQFDCTVFELCEQTDKQRRRQIDILITILRNPIPGQNKNSYYAFITLNMLIRTCRWWRYSLQELLKDVDHTRRNFWLNVDEADISQILQVRMTVKLHQRPACGLCHDITRHTTNS